MRVKVLENVLFLAVVLACVYFLGWQAVMALSMLGGPLLCLVGSAKMGKATLLRVCAHACLACLGTALVSVPVMYAGIRFDCLPEEILYLKWHWVFIAQVSVLIGLWVVVPTTFVCEELRARFAVMRTVPLVYVPVLLNVSAVAFGNFIMFYPGCECVK